MGIEQLLPKLVGFFPPDKCRTDRSLGANAVDPLLQLPIQVGNPLNRCLQQRRNVGELGLDGRKPQVRRREGRALIAALISQILSHIYESFVDSGDGQCRLISRQVPPIEAAFHRPGDHLKEASRYRH